MTNTQIKPVTKYEVNGKLFDTEEDAQQFVNHQAIVQFFEADDGDNLYFGPNSSGTKDIAEYIIKRKERLIHLLSFIK